MSESMQTATSIQTSVRTYLKEHFSELGDVSPQNIYQRVLELVELPLLEEVMKKAGNNQCRATRYLGLARGTVIKKLKQYELIRPKSRSTPAANRNKQETLAEETEEV